MEDDIILEELKKSIAKKNQSIKRMTILLEASQEYIKGLIEELSLNEQTLKVLEEKEKDNENK